MEDESVFAEAWEYNKAIGELEVDFDSNGDVERCGGRPRFAFDNSKMQSGRRRSSQAFALPAEDISKVSSTKGE